MLGHPLWGCEISRGGGKSPVGTHHLCPVRQHHPLVVQDDEPDVAVGAVGQRGAQVARDEVPLVLGGEAQALEGVEDDLAGRGLIPRRHCPEGQVVFGVFIQEPAHGGKMAKGPIAPALGTATPAPTALAWPLTE